VSNEEVNKSMGKMLKSVGQARQGLLAQKRAFELLGLSADTLANTDPAEAMIQILGALNKVPNAADKAAAATDIFGRGGMKLIPMAKGGADGIRSLMKEADKLGMTFSGKMAASVEEANDSLTRLWGVFQGAATTLTVQLAPYIQEASDRLREFALSGEGLASTVGAAFDSTVMFVRNFIDELTRSDTLVGSILAKAKEMLGIESGNLQQQLDSAKTRLAELKAFKADKSWFKMQTGKPGSELFEETDESIDRYSKMIQTLTRQIAHNKIKSTSEGWGGGLWDDLGGNDQSKRPVGGGGLAQRSGSFRQVAFSKAAVGGPGTTKTPIQADPAELTLLASIRDLDQDRIRQAWRWRDRSGMADVKVDLVGDIGCTEEFGELVEARIGARVKFLRYEVTDAGLYSYVLGLAACRSRRKRLTRIIPS
jgi:hypothetical protein